VRKSNDILAANVVPRSWAGLVDPHYPRLGMGFDVATTLRKKGKGGNKSNPSAICVMQEIGLMYHIRLMLRFRTNDPRIANLIIESILASLAEIHSGMRVRRLCVDATNERFFAANLKANFSGRLPVEPVVGSEGMEYRGQKMTSKAYLGNLLADHLEDGYVAMPETDWLQKDFRLVKRVAETFDAEIDEDGNHGDTFDAAKLALHALVAKGGPAEAAGVAVGSYAKPNPTAGRKFHNPYAHLYDGSGGNRRPT
jgi:hypothetical protein